MSEQTVMEKFSKCMEEAGIVISANPTAVPGPKYDDGESAIITFEVAMRYENGTDPIPLQKIVEDFFEKLVTAIEG